MIVTCENCRTRFHLDDRIVEEQTKPVVQVRCSRCRHEFPQRLLGPGLDPGASDSEPVIGRRRVISVCNQKGGVAKTSTCLNLGVSLALLGKSVVLVDFDVQANLSASLGFYEQPSMYDVIREPGRSIRTVVQKTRYDHLWIVPGSSRMALLSQQYMNAERYQNLLADRLQDIRDRFDVLLIDTPPLVEFFTLNALMACDLALIPTQCEYFSYQGAEKIRRIIEVINRGGNRAIDYRMLITMYDNVRLSSRVLASKLRSRYGKRTLQTVIELDEKMSESQVVRVPLIFHDKNARAAREYLALARELLGSG